MTDGTDAKDAPPVVGAEAPAAPDLPGFPAAPVHQAIEAAPVAAAITAEEATQVLASVSVPAESVPPEVPPEVPPAPAAPAAPVSHKVRKRRRWPWVSALVFVLALVLLASGFLWYTSGLIGAGMKVDRGGEPFPMTILSADGGALSYSGSKGGWEDMGLAGVATIEGGYVQTSSPSTAGSGDTATTTRTITKQVLPPPPVAGQSAALDGFYFPRNPLVGLGVPYEDITYPSPAGATPAWFIPGPSSTWVIFTHGRGSTPLEGLRMASTVATLGYPMLLIKYRDDAKAPVDDGLGNFGVKEWPDLQAAVQYALDKGATRIVLAGASMGGSITLAFLQHSPLAGKVAGAFLDAPVSDLSQVVLLSGRDMGLPDFATSAAMRVASWRYGIDWAATDYTAAARTFTTPMVIVQGTEDRTVPAVVNQDFAAAATPGLVALELFEGAGHVMSWNVDRPRYERLLTDFLGKVAPSP